MRVLEGTESAGMTWVLARLVVEPHSEMTSLMVIMLDCSQTGESMRLLPPLALRWSRSGTISSSGLLELVL